MRNRERYQSGPFNFYLKEYQNIVPSPTPYFQCIDNDFGTQQMSEYREISQLVCDDCNLLNFGFNVF